MLIWGLAGMALLLCLSGVIPVARFAAEEINISVYPDHVLVEGD